MNLSWESPPPAQTGSANKGRRRSAYWEVLDELEKNPGKWALIEKEHNGASSPLYALVRNNRLPFEVSTRKNDNGTFAIYARRTVEEK